MEADEKVCVEGTDAAECKGAQLSAEDILC